MANVTTCPRCARLYEAASEEAAGAPDRLCPRCAAAPPLWIITVVKGGLMTRLVFGCEAPALRARDLLGESGDQPLMTRASWAPDRGPAELERAEKLLDFLFGGRDEQQPAH